MKATFICIFLACGCGGTQKTNSADIVGCGTGYGLPTPIKTNTTNQLHPSGRHLVNTRFAMSKGPINEKLVNSIRFNVNEKSGSSTQEAIGAVVELSTEALQGVLVGVANEQGFVMFPNLVIGKYDVAVYYLDGSAKKQIAVGSKEHWVVNVEFADSL